MNTIPYKHALELCLGHKVRLLAAKPNRLSSIPRTLRAEERTNPHKMSSDFHANNEAWNQLYTHIATHKKNQ